MGIILIIIVLVAGVVIGAAIVMGEREDKGLEKSEQSRLKDERKEKILKMIQDHGRVANNDVKKSLGVSDATATNYLDELEKEDKIKQVGKTGRGVTYEFK